MTGPGEVHTSPEESCEESLDAVYRALAYDTFVTLYWRTARFDEAADRLRRAGFAVVVLDASGWTTDDAFHTDVAAALDFPDYYGANLDAFNDCLGDVMGGAYGVPQDAPGVALAFTHYDVFAAACPREAHVVLDIVADHARRAAVFGGRLLCLVQSDDPDLRQEPVGAQPVLWNRYEWLDSSRRPAPAAPKGAAG
ncbi:barstar family protein [Streptacidiphilus melanogenes]|uniref:barstar family protein n=1 Tax=Streptacidiphilus melanogenes TaxID=411235 RepID=UPI0005AB609F|nr:barstar family protein [Streptacidiphilus melanogenes]